MFPFNQPPPTAFYVALYMATLVLHVVPMCYVLGGQTWLATVGLWEAARGPASAPVRGISAALRDWMPLALAVTITAGVAPLLFLQVLCQTPFYTANLLLFHRWMAILPVLIAAFYLLYLQKSKRFVDWPAAGRAAVALIVMLLFGFVAWSWTENHVLSLQGQAVRVEQYSAGGLFYENAETGPRLALWWAGALAVMAGLAYCQTGRLAGASRPLAWLGLASLTAAPLAALAWQRSLPPEVWSGLVAQVWPYAALLLAGAAAQLVMWALVMRSRRFLPLVAWLLPAAASLTTLGVAGVRELRRWQSVDIAGFYEAHARAAAVGGWGLFLFFLLLNTAIIVGLLAVVRRGVRRSPVDRA
ncbi:hypothetical protein Pla175_01150 [Pirellulimonas nuda]|uniref:Uncharacterized protein n=1 Tax=Pirellulimonas nuda TaxID=2528009 RepID=A0A518D5L7_9BACT|nr:hypothetical protein [Pirellulimonas nuda]QDU86765.1 hypothetical protein Pla175_01150 [Pirellulimonas nuda]